MNNNKGKQFVNKYNKDKRSWKTKHYLNQVKLELNKIELKSEIKKKKENEYKNLIYSKKRKSIISYVKYIQDTYKQKNEIVADANTELNLNRYLIFYKLYKKEEQKYAAVDGELRKIKNRKKRSPKSAYLWKSLTLNNLKNVYKYNINYNIDLDKSYDQYNLKALNFYKKKGNKKKAILYKFFKNKKIAYIIKNRYNVNKNELFYNVKNNFISLFSHFHLFNIHYLYNNHFKPFTYRPNYLFYFYSILKHNILLKISNMLNIKNYFNYVSLYEEEVDFNIINKKALIYNIPFLNFNTNKSVKDSTVALKKVINQTSFWTRCFMKKKIWSKNAMYFWSYKNLQKMITIFIKLNIKFDIKKKVKKINNKLFYNTNSKYLLDNTKLQLSKYWKLFSSYIYKTVFFNNFIYKKYKINNNYILKKYSYFIYFIKLYLFKIFKSLKFIYFLDNNKIQHHIRKLKFLLFLIFYKQQSKKYTMRHWKRTNFKKFLKKTKLKWGNYFNFKFFRYWRVKKKRQEKKKYLLKKSKVNKNNANIYRQPVSIFRYNSYLNVKHAKYVNKKKKKHQNNYKFLYNVLKRIIRKKKQKRQELLKALKSKSKSKLQIRMKVLAKMKAIDFIINKQTRREQKALKKSKKKVKSLKKQIKYVKILKKAAAVLKKEKELNIKRLKKIILNVRH